MLQECCSPHSKGTLEVRSFVSSTNISFLPHNTGIVQYKDISGKDEK